MGYQNSFQKEVKTAPKRPTLFCLVYQAEFLAILRQIRIIAEDFRRLPKILKDWGRFPVTNEEVWLLPKMPEEPFKHLTVLSSETANITKTAKLTANTKNYGQITLNTKSQSHSLKRLRQYPPGNWVIWIFSEQKPCTRII